MQEDDTLMNNQVFRDYKLPAAREKGRLPIFLDFSSGAFQEDSLVPSKINEIISATSIFIDGVFLRKHTLPDLCAYRKDIWVHADQPSIAMTMSLERKEMDLPTLSSGYLSQSGVSGIVGRLNLGSSASNEADNI